MSKGLSTGIKYFVIHLCVEIVCFAVLFRYYSLETSVLISLTYDFAAFLPQGLFGELLNRFRRLPFETIGVLLMGVGTFLSGGAAFGLHLTGIVLLGLGNAVIHACGAVSTVAVCRGKIFPSALFVGGGSFGVVIGQTMGKAGLALYWLLIPLAIIEILTMFSGEWKRAELFPEFHVAHLKQEKSEKANGPGYSVAAIILIAFLVTAVRSFIGYAIPISWKKEVWQAFLLFFAMGIGKALGGFLVDLFGARRIGVLSTLLAIPFLVVGKNNMIISVIGVCLFSMTMCITFAMLLSVMPQNPGLSFGVTTIGLALGLLPVFFYSFDGLTDTILVIVLSLICAALLGTACTNEKADGSR